MGKDSSLTESQHRFRELLDQLPWLQPYWDFGTRACDVTGLEAAMNSWSHGEQLMARFFALIWFGENRMGFELADAASVLDHRHRMIIIHWLEEPFWP